jgi:hypothetical protein
MDPVSNAVVRKQHCLALGTISEMIPLVPRLLAWTRRFRQFAMAPPEPYYHWSFMGPYTSGDVFGFTKFRWCLSYLVDPGARAGIRKCPCPSLGATTEMIPLVPRLLAWTRRFRQFAMAPPEPHHRWSFAGPRTSGDVSGSTNFRR